ncbi:NADP-dependent oxidoreductase domain-containing protein [Pelagophyceae sp. CCMP2097]|nr:NADP-dependent oxidoreductase domain-containing protein [Pelagophyceae sp. CCMP2097]|mmetsp:Transcript_4594/g.16350  ORF Transcript_4594/g.16350 Transcript_4594/m.16350 type:complete len:331 (-) Transcript_4594:98-1090(-)
MTKTAGLRVVLGTMTFSAQSDKAASVLQLKALLAAGHSELDTARMYEHGKTEKLLGEVLHSDAFKNAGFKVASKANPFQGYGETLSAVSVATQMAETLRDLNAPKVSIYYLHGPDAQTPILETLEAVNKLHAAGCFEEFGLSNFCAWEVAHICGLCSERGWVKPTVYQGMYNALTRDVEAELLPCLLALKIRFNAFNPLAGGLLACARSRRDYDGLDDSSRFRKGNPTYRKRYLADPQLDAVDAVQAACSAANVAPANAALRWLAHHSKLRQDDGVIVGASKLSHLEENLLALEEGPLDQGIVDAFEAGWQQIRAAGVCPSYHRGNSKYV